MKLFTIETLSDLSQIFESIESPTISPTKIVVQNLTPFERQMINDLSYSHKQFVDRYCTESLTSKEELNCVTKRVWQTLQQNDKAHSWNIGKFIKSIVQIFRIEIHSKSTSFCAQSISE